MLSATVGTAYACTLSFLLSSTIIFFMQGNHTKAFIFHINIFLEEVYLDATKVLFLAVERNIKINHRPYHVALSLHLWCQK